MCNDSQKAFLGVGEIPSELGGAWQIGSDGLPYRKAARVIIFNEFGQMLLVKGHDFGNRDHSWWFTIGGGLEDNESEQEAARRELLEETGIEVGVADLQGPILRRRGLFVFSKITCRQDEVFFWLKIPHQDNFSSARFTEMEQNVLDGLAWWDLVDLAKAQGEGQLVYPQELPSLAASWKHGWDGKCQTISEI